MNYIAVTVDRCSPLKGVVEPLTGGGELIFLLYHVA